jgi:hypothetical protein
MFKLVMVRVIVRAHAVPALILPAAMSVPVIVSMVMSVIMSVVVSMIVSVIVFVIVPMVMVVVVVVIMLEVVAELLAGDVHVRAPDDVPVHGRRQEDAVRGPERGRVEAVVSGVNALWEILRELNLDG